MDRAEENVIKSHLSADFIVVKVESGERSVAVFSGIQHPLCKRGTQLKRVSCVTQG